MAEWPQFFQSVIIGLIFSFLLAKLFSIIFAFRDENLRITRADPDEGAESKSSKIESPEVAGSKSRVLEEKEPLIEQKEEENASLSGANGSDSDSDWEGVESTELDEAFSAATAFVAATAADKSSHKVSNELQLQLYALYKIATEGPCSTPQPSALKMTARAKWQAWQKLGAMPPEEAMQKYIDIVTELYPSWATGSAIKKQGTETTGTSNAESKGPMGPVFSTFVYEDEPGNDLKLDALHAFAREGDAENLIKCIESGVPVNVKGESVQKGTKNRSSVSSLGLKQILEAPNRCKAILRNTFCDASELVRTGMVFLERTPATEAAIQGNSSKGTKQMNVIVLHIIRKYSDKILLEDSDKEPKIKKKKVKKSPSGMTHKERLLAEVDDWQGPPPWDSSLGGDGCPKFLCDVMVEGLAKHLRCVGVDAAIPHSKKPETRDLIEQAHKEKRVLLTRDAKLLRHNYLIKNQIYRVKALLKNEQLLEVIETFQLKICEDQLMSRCTKCNGKFIQKPLTTEEAVEAAKGFQVIPNCLFNRNLEFWQCIDCNRLYWEGTQYHNAVQKFIDMFKLNA